MDTMNAARIILGAIIKSTFIILAFTLGMCGACFAFGVVFYLFWTTLAFIFSHIF